MKRTKDERLELFIGESSLIRWGRLIQFLRRFVHIGRLRFRGGFVRIHRARLLQADVPGQRLVQPMGSVLAERVPLSIAEIISQCIAIDRMSTFLDDQFRPLTRTSSAQICQTMLADHDLHRMFVVIDVRDLKSRRFSSSSLSLERLYHRNKGGDLSAFRHRRSHEDGNVLNEDEISPLLFGEGRRTYGIASEISTPTDSIHHR